jgi:CBS domain-containing protein
MSANDHPIQRPPSLTETFHRLGRILPDDQVLRCIDQTATVKEAFSIMKEHGYSQLPVRSGNRITGMFSYRSFAREIVEYEDVLEGNVKPGDIEVGELMEPAKFALGSDEFCAWFETLDKFDAFLLGEPTRVQGLLSTMDLLNYLYGVANPFVLVAEIELSLRSLITHAVSDDQLKECMRVAKVRAKTFDRATFGDYIYIITEEPNWQLFQPVFRGNPFRTKARLSEACELRNKAFHFNGMLTTDDYTELVRIRDWIMAKSVRNEAEGTQQ